MSRCDGPPPRKMLIIDFLLTGGFIASASARKTSASVAPPMVSAPPARPPIFRKFRRETRSQKRSDFPTMVNMAGPPVLGLGESRLAGIEAAGGDLGRLGPR